MRRLALIVLCLSAAVLGHAATAEAAHFRGGAMVPRVSASGELTLTVTTFWRKPGTGYRASPSLPGVSLTQASVETDSSDSRFDTVVQVYTGQLPAAGTYAITWGSSARVGGVRNALESSWHLTSAIAWNGAGANVPITFNLAAVQPEVVQGESYAGSLGAIAGAGVTLSYDQDLAVSITSQPPGFTIDPATGALSIPAASTLGWLENTAGNDGADYAFSGNIHASDGSRVQFDWLFDLVDEHANRAPVVADAAVTAAAGETVSHTFTATDPNGDPLAWTFLELLGDAAVAPSFDPATQLFTWDTTGSAPGTYIALVRASDGSKNDTGQLTITLAAGSPAPPPAPPAAARPAPPTAPPPGALEIAIPEPLGWTVRLAPAPPPQPGFARSRDVVLTIATPAGATYVWIANDPDFATGRLVEASELGLYPWTLDGAGERTVYVRFANAGGFSAVLAQGVVVDEGRPVVLRAVFVGAGKKPRRLAAAARRSWIAIEASDDLSGLAWMQFAADRAKPFSWRPFVSHASVRVKQPTAWVRVADRAGNVSHWLRVPLKTSR